MSSDVAKTREWTLAELHTAPIETITTKLKGKPYRACGVQLWALLRAAALKTDPKKHPEARFVVLARGKDGHLASFALSELLPDVREGAFLVCEEGGKPLLAKEGPFRLVVPREAKPMRWVYRFAALEIYDGKRLIHTPFNSKAVLKP